MRVLLTVALLLSACSDDTLRQFCASCSNPSVSETSASAVPANLPPGTIEQNGRLSVPADYNRRNSSMPDVRVSNPAAQREAELLQRALTGSPDYTAAVRRAAIANIDANPEAAPASRRSRADAALAREQRIAAEEARLSDAIEQRRRAQLALNEQQGRSARDQQAAATCQARGAQIDAAYYNPRALVNLDGMVAGIQARNTCLEAYQRTGILP